LLVWLIQLTVSIAAGIALLLVAFILALPAIILAVAGYTTVAIVVGIVAALILLPILLVAAGAFDTFSHSYWTLAYL
jgi:xanthine/uracil/vitamin C permease (AzgA family)